MAVTLAKTAGFCFGVERAVKMVYKKLEEGGKVATFGPIINNPQVVADLESKGCRVVASAAEVPPGYMVIIRSHGILKSEEQALDLLGIAKEDATCPFVKKIQKIAEKLDDPNTILLIAGDAKHPEIKSIYSYSRVLTHVFKDNNELENLLKSIPGQSNFNFIVIAQTTFNTKEWNNCVKTVKKVCTNSQIFDTICNATSLRQNEAALLAQNNQKMIVVGGRHSSNTRKLHEICSQYCETFLVETATELCAQDFFGVSSVGLTAGASTPVCIIKEVQTTMKEMLNDDLSFEEMLDLSFKNIYTGEKVSAVVTRVAPNEITVDVGTKHTGYVPVAEFTEDPLAKVEELVKVGDTLELVVLRVNDVEGTIMLSKKKLDAAAGFEKVMSAGETGEVLTGVITEVIKGGVIALTNGVKVFIPASQATLYRTDDLTALLKTKVDFVILETNHQRRRAVGSIRAVLSKMRKELEGKFWETAEQFGEYTGTVKSLTPYAAFVDLGGVDGLLHITELSWSRLKHPSEVVNIGDTVEVYIKELDKENRKISLGFKGKGENPWDVFVRDYKQDDVVKAKVVVLTPFGAFAQIIPGVDGLVHISQISLDRIKHPSDVLKVGEMVDAKILEIDADKKRISLSIKALLEPQTEEAPAEETAE